MTMLTVQYLEAPGEIPGLRVDAVVDRLRRAADRLPFTHLLIGWRVPPPILEACRVEAERLGMRFLRWHPLLSGGIGSQQPAPNWRVVGLSGERLPGFMNLPEFTFACPNHPEVREAVSRELEALINTGVYHGFFLDRIRYPSPAADLPNMLGCFCEHCRRKAAALGVDLEAARDAINHLGQDAGSLWNLALALLGPQPEERSRPGGDPVQAFLDFRCRSVTELCAGLGAAIRRAGLEVGIDCFSPSLTRMVGQDLAALGSHADWTKIMTYGHTWGPAGLPFELAGICASLGAATSRDQGEILGRLGDALHSPLPGTRKALEASGLPPASLAREVEAGVSLSSAPILAGLELVDIPGITNLNDTQVRADLRSIQAARPAGLSLSWDLWHIPLARLDLVREVYLGK